MDAVADKLFVVEGDGPVRMFDGQFSEVVACLPAVWFDITLPGLTGLCHDMHSGPICPSLG